MVRSLPSLVAALVLGACASTAPLNAPTRTHGHGGVAIELRIKVHGMVTYRADTVFFVRDCAVGAGPCDGQLLASTMGREGRLYLLDVPPGDYRAVASSMGTPVPGDHNLYFTYFTSAMSTATATHVDAGRLAFAGSYVVPASFGLCAGEAEPGQLQLAEQVEPGTAKCGLLRTSLEKLKGSGLLFVAGMAMPVGGLAYHYRGTGFERQATEALLQGFAGKSRKDLAGTPWQDAPLAGR